MFRIGDYVSYGCKGIHRIVGETTLNIDGISRDRAFFVLEPCRKPDGMIYAPVESADKNMRLIMTPEEAEAFIRTIPDIEILNIKNPRLRDDTFKEAIRSTDPSGLVRVIKTLILRRRERLQQGKKLTINDMHFLEQAETILYEELAITLRRDRSSIPEYLSDFMNR